LREGRGGLRKGIEGGREGEGGIEGGEGGSLKERGPGGAIDAV
jgi:hypothetical protein